MPPRKAPIGEKFETPAAVPAPAPHGALRRSWHWLLAFERLEAKKKLSLLLVFCALVATSAALYFYRQYSVVKKNPQYFAERETRVLVAQVSKLIVLPEGEEPTVATVSDPEKLKDQPFFANAKLGDKVIIYSKARKAILYDPKAHRIVEVAPLNIGN